MLNLSEGFHDFFMSIFTLFRGVKRQRKAYRQGYYFIERSNAVETQNDDLESGLEKMKEYRNELNKERVNFNWINRV
jgi:hypothetical protein